MSQDRISNMLSTIKNASMVGKKAVEIFYSKETENVLKVLQKNGFVKDVKVFKHKASPFKGLHIDLFLGDEVKFSQIKRLSKPGRRLYISSKEIKPVVGGKGLMVLSTSQGIMDGFSAKKKNLGGEIICKLY